MLGGGLLVVQTIMRLTMERTVTGYWVQSFMVVASLVLVFAGFGMRNGAVWSKWAAGKGLLADPQVAAFYAAPPDCPTCGRGIAGESAFCPSCGAGIRTQDPPLMDQIRASFARFFWRQPPEPPRAQAFHQGVQQGESHRFLWVSLIVVALGFLSYFGNGPLQSLGITVLVVVPPVLLLFWLREQDRFEREPLGLLFAAFAWGVACGPIVVPINTLINFLTTDPATGQSFLHASQAGPVEEGAKALFVFALATHVVFRRELNGVVDGLVYGACVGLGFAAWENFLYIFTNFGGEENPAVIFPGFLIRFTGNFAHSLWAGLAGGYLGLMLLRNGRVTWRNFVAAVAPSAIIHGVSNASNSFVTGPTAVFVRGLVLGISAFAFFKLMAEGQRDESAWGIGKAPAPAQAPAFAADSGSPG